MNQLHPTIAASLAGFVPRFAATSCSQCGKSLGPGNAGVSKCAEHRVPTDSHWTTIGEGDASVECRYNFDSDGDLDTLKVMLDNTDIAAALTCQQLGELEDECRDAAKADYEEHKDDARIDAYIERMAA